MLKTIEVNVCDYCGGQSELLPCVSCGKTACNKCSLRLLIPLEGETKVLCLCKNCQAPLRALLKKYKIEVP